MILAIVLLAWATLAVATMLTNGGGGVNAPCPSCVATIAVGLRVLLDTVVRGTSAAAHPQNRVLLAGGLWASSWTATNAEAGTRGVTPTVAHRVTATGRGRTPRRWWAPLDLDRLRHGDRRRG